ncbi:uncharacterized protein LOC107303725 isoform X1 [Oryza brachyantha]|uniref:uncharacterized protein LOC107303725 isoform X1 n=1 Tax=Oryza brachyantha TaxID=4533 RepID=UPI001ADB9D6D|nr:uncharacterized protein LOC107303725 isoform X1 [Oryza brachyantha]XP_040378187.1 uncharacterized protein LOC107303725 isoform X1 [Oryza brachyantha]
MTLGRRQCRPIENSVAIENLIEDEGYLRGPSELPPAIPNEKDRPLIEPDGNTHWIELSILHKGRKPASVLSCLLREYHPGIVNYKGKTLVAKKWLHYEAQKDTSGRSVANEVEDNFWLRFRCEPQYAEAARQHVGRCCKVLITSVMYYARINAIIDHCRKVEKQKKISDKAAGHCYLLRNEYIAQKPKWCTQEAWAVLVDEWCDPSWIKKSEKSRANRTNSKYKPHKGGSNSIAIIRQKMSMREGRDISKIEAWVYTHRGADPNNPDELNTEEATECLKDYRTNVARLRGKGYNWKNNPVDPQALYNCSARKGHGRWATFNGLINDKEAIDEVRVGRASSVVRKRLCQEQDENEKRRQSEKIRRTEDHAKSVLSWGLGLYDHCNGMHKLLVTLATNQGVPANEIPPRFPPPPSPPGSHNESPILHDHNMIALVELKNQESAFNVVAEGMFGGYLSAMCNEAESSSPNLDDEIDPF